MSSLSARSSSRNLRTLSQYPDETVFVNIDGHYRDVTSENIDAITAETLQKIDLLKSRVKDLDGKKNKCNAIKDRITELEHLHDLLEGTSDKIAKKAARATEVSLFLLFVLCYVCNAVSQSRVH